MKKVLIIIISILMLCSCSAIGGKTELVEGIHKPYPMEIQYAGSSIVIKGIISSWNFPGNDEYDFYCIEAELESALESKNITSVIAREENEAKLVFHESMIPYEIRRWKVEPDYLEKEYGGYEFGDKGEKVTLKDGFFEVPKDGIYVYEVHAFHEYGNCYYRFRIDPSSEWSFNISVKNVTPESATLVLTKSGGTPDDELMTGSYFRIENENGELAFITEGDITWTAEAYNIPENGELEMEVNWKWLYGALEPGTYRIFKNVRNNSDPGDLIKEGSVEFTVE